MKHLLSVRPPFSLLRPTFPMVYTETIFAFRDNTHKLNSIDEGFILRGHAKIIFAFLDWLRVNPSVRV